MGWKNCLKGCEKVLKVYAIGHSGFLVETEQIYLLFDYYQGEMPMLDPKKKLFVFVSHKHADHYNREIWKWKEQYGDACFILSKDVPFSARQRGILGISEEDCARVLRVRANERYSLTDREGETIWIDTLKSTDLGVAYLVCYKGRYIYHAGDLNRWVWKGESEDWNRDMAERYTKQLEELQKILGERRILLAFLPVDPRQEEEAFGGICEFLEKIAVDFVFPMHLWGKYYLAELCVKAVEERVSEEKARSIVSGIGERKEWEFC